MIVHEIPYGHGCLRFSLPEWIRPEAIEIRKTRSVSDPELAVHNAISNPEGGILLSDYRGAKTAAIAVNDRTRPVPNAQLLPPLVNHLEQIGIKSAEIQFIIATGTHPRVAPADYPEILPREILDRCQVDCHDCDERGTLIRLGDTSRGTPVWVNRRFAEADLRIVIGNIEPHQFQGFSGGVKGAAIGLAGRETIEKNHALMTSSKARSGRYSDNPARQEVEEIGRMIGVHYALNALLNSDKQIVSVIAGDPYRVMERGIPISRKISQVRLRNQFDLVIASPGGYPKDINLYQSQKALAGAAKITRRGGTVILAAACKEGTGNRDYERFMDRVSSHQEVIERFKQEGFSLGPHKAVQIAMDAIRVNVILVSELDPRMVRKCLLTPASSIDEALSSSPVVLSGETEVGIMPQASFTIPVTMAD